MFIVDIDGTIAKNTNRNIYDFNNVINDDIIHPVAEIINNLANHKTGCDCFKCDCCYDGCSNDCNNNLYKIIFVSGRPDICFKETKKWIKFYILKDNEPYDLYMRKKDDFRSDEIIKEEIYNEHIKNKYEVIAVFDDRPKVIKMWRKLGLFVFNCAQNDIEF